VGGKTLHHTATHCNTLQHRKKALTQDLIVRIQVAVCCSALQCVAVPFFFLATQEKGTYTGSDVRISRIARSGGGFRSFLCGCVGVCVW